MDAPGWRPWQNAMADALYGEGGFYRAAGAPGRNFRTAAHASALWAAAIARLADLVDAALGRPPTFAVVDMGAGGGELLAGLAELLPDRFRLIGVDVAARPEGLADRVEWRAEPPTRITGLLVAVEWLDVVPLDVAEVDDDAQVRLVEVNDRGQERLGPVLDGEPAAWLRRWWPLATEPGRRAEIGTTRDRAWKAVTDAMTAGLAVAVDYAAVPDRDLAGTLTGYRAGRICRPVPDGSMDLTASVCFDSLRAEGDLLLTQRNALRWLGVDGKPPAYGGDPASYLQELAGVSAAAELLDPAGLGGFSWLLHAVAIDLSDAQRAIAD